jgi:molecular chaperone DnaK
VPFHEVRIPLCDALERLKEKAKGEDTAAIKQAIADVEQASHAMAQHLYKSAGAGAQPSADGTAAGGEAKGKDDVIDAEFEVKK